MAELYGVKYEYLDSEEYLSDVLKEAIPKGNAHIRGVISEKFVPCGVSVVALLSESHASFHTYPEHGCLFLDVFTCGDCKPVAIYEAIVERLAPESSRFEEVARGFSEVHGGVKDGQVPDNGQLIENADEAEGHESPRSVVSI